ILAKVRSIPRRVRYKISRLKRILPQSPPQEPKAAPVVWDEYPHRDYPALDAKHVSDARLFANREDLISSMRFVEGGVVAEVGVAQGNFSEHLLASLRPRTFVAFDTFAMHERPTAWGVPTSQLFNNMTHGEFYRKRFADRGAQVVLEVG